MTQLNRSYVVRCLSGLLVLSAVGMFSASASAQGLNYVDGTHLVDPFNLPDFAAIAGGTGNDNLWGPRQDFGSGAMPSALDGIGVFESANGTGDDSPEMRFVFTGFQTLPAGNYDIYSVFWTDDDENWTLSTGTTSGNLTPYSFSGSGGIAPITLVSTTKGITAAGAVWTTLPPVTPAGTTLYDRPGADPLIMLLAKAGTVVADGVSDVTIYVDDLPGQGGSRRSWFDGVAYIAAGTPIAITTTIDRGTGELIITNPTSQDFLIKSIDIQSPGAALIGSEWDPITGRLDSGNGFDDDPWSIGVPADPANTPFANQLTESEQALPFTPGGTLAANGGTLNLGALWRKTPLEDVIVRLTLSDDTPVTISPTYTGGPVVIGDFNSNGSLEIGDFQILLDNLQTSVAGLSAIEQYSMGNLINDPEINWSDYQGFRDLWNAGHGAGSFEAMVAGMQVPEPSGIVLMLGIAVTLLGYFRRHRSRLLIAGFTCSLMVVLASSASALDIKVDIDSTRTNATTIGTPFTTQAGFTSWDLTNVGNTAGSNVMSIDGVTFEIFGFPTSETDPNVGINQSRIRTTGGGGPIDALLADFVYNEGAGGRAVGLRMTDLPVGIYHMESWHYDGVNQIDATRVNLRSQGVPNTQTLVQNAFWSQNAVPFLVEVTELTPPREVIFVENSTNNRARLNGFTLKDFDGLTLEVTTNTGAMRILNEQGAPIDISYYEIQSPTSQLVNGNWTSFASLESDGVSEGWDEITNPSPNVLSEVNLTSMSTIAQSGMPGDFFDLGNSFAVNGTEDLRFVYAGLGDDNLKAGLVKYVTSGALGGDYNGDGVVNAADYVLGRDQGPAGFHTDFLNNFGGMSGSGSGAATAIPEPATIVLLGVALLGLAFVRKRR